MQLSYVSKVIYLFHYWIVFISVLQLRLMPNTSAMWSLRLEYIKYVVLLTNNITAQVKYHKLLFSSHIILKQVFSLRLFLIWNIHKHIKIIHAFVRNEYKLISKCTVNRNEDIVIIANILLLISIFSRLLV